MASNQQLPSVAEAKAQLRQAERAAHEQRREKWRADLVEVRRQLKAERVAYMKLKRECDRNRYQLSQAEAKRNRLESRRGELVNVENFDTLVELSEAGDAEAVEWARQLAEVDAALEQITEKCRAARALLAENAKVALRFEGVAGRLLQLEISEQNLANWLRAPAPGQVPITRNENGVLSIG